MTPISIHVYYHLGGTFFWVDDLSIIICNTPPKISMTIEHHHLKMYFLLKLVIVPLPGLFSGE